MPKVDNRYVLIDFDLGATADNIEAEVKKAVLDQQKRNARAIKQATASWKKKLELEIEETDEGVTISTDDPRYLWVDEGTKPHEIKPRNAKALRFLPGNKVRSEIARRQKNAAQRDAKAVFTKSVMHPGIRPRSITELVLAKRQLAMVSAIEAAIEKAINK